MSSSVPDKTTVVSISVGALTTLVWFLSSMFRHDVSIQNTALTSSVGALTTLVRSLFSMFQHDVSIQTTFPIACILTLRAGKR